MAPKKPSGVRWRFGTGWPSNARPSTPVSHSPTIVASVTRCCGRRLSTYPSARVAAPNPSKPNSHTAYQPGRPTRGRRRRWPAAVVSWATPGCVCRERVYPPTPCLSPARIDRRSVVQRNRRCIEYRLDRLGVELPARVAGVLGRLDEMGERRVDHVRARRVIRGVARHDLARLVE